MKKVAFIIHGKAKSPHKITDELEIVFSGNYKLGFFNTMYPAHAVDLTAEAIADGYDYVICVGGDGSMNEVANGYMKAVEQGHVNGRNVYLGLLPYGTGNDFARTMQVSFNTTVLEDLIDSNSYKVIDLGRVEYVKADKTPATRYFINITDLGMGGVVAEKLNRYSKVFGANFTFQRAILSTLVTYKNQPVEATADSFTYNGKMLNFIVANGKYFGSGMGIAPDANPADGVFSIVIAGEISMLDYIKNLGTVRKCQKIDHPQLMYKSAKTVTLQSPAGPLPIDMDGEFIGYSPMSIQVVPSAVKFLAP